MEPPPRLLGLSAEEYLTEQKVKELLNRIVVSLLESRPSDIRRHVLKLLLTGPGESKTVELFPTYGKSSYGEKRVKCSDVASSKNAISRDVLNKAGQGVRRHGVSSKMTSSTSVEIKVYPKDEATFAALEASTRQVGMLDFLDDDQRHALVDSMFECKFHDGDVIIREGDDGDNFYIMLSGRCSVRRSIDGSEEEAGFLDPGAYFGEIALITGGKRTASVIAIGDTVCWAIDQVTYRTLLKEQHSQKRARYQALLREVEFLDVLQDYEILLVADALKPVYPKEGEVIVRQGDSGDEFFIILEGECTVHRKDDGDGEEREVRTLKSGEYFGEVALLENTPRIATVIAGRKCRLVKLERSSFCRLLGPCSEMFKAHMESYEK